MKIQFLCVVCKFQVLVVVSILLSGLFSTVAEAQLSEVATADTVCRFGITSPSGSDGYDIASLGVGSYLDWAAVRNPSLPTGVEYIRVLRVRDDLYPGTLANLPGWVTANPGSVWIIGNEPDTTYPPQDNLMPEVYADRYFALATTIRRLDPTAKIAFGSIVQPTPIRLRYLDRAWNELIIKAGSPALASLLIDIWSIHSFILNEDVDHPENNWGTGVPKGFESDHEDAVIITLDQIYKTYSIDIYKQRIIAFRDWMANKGERSKPLWVTEYGSLFPPINQNGTPNYWGVTDEISADFMVATFDFMLGARDEQTGLPEDGNLLVQRWFWYSLNEHRYTFGGSIFNPDYPEFGTRTTWVGQKYIEYQEFNLKQPDLFPESLSIAPISFDPEEMLGTYRVSVVLGNKAFADASCAQVWIYDGYPDGGGSLLAGPIPSSAIHNNYGSGITKIDWKNVIPEELHMLCVLVEAVGPADKDPNNNQACFPVFPEIPQIFFLPVINQR